jgi:hypothetical protein
MWMNPAITPDLQISVKIQCPTVLRYSQETINVLVTLDIITMVEHVIFVSILIYLLKITKSIFLVFSSPDPNGQRSCEV